MYLTSMNGHMLKRFGSPGNEWGKFLEPSGVTGDQNGYVLVADSKHDRIQVRLFHFEMRQSCSIMQKLS